MKKQTYKLLKRGFLVLLALVTFLLVLNPMPVSSSDPLIVKNVSNETNKIMDEDFYLFCLATLQDKDSANESEIIHQYQDNNYEISTQPS
jgi:uncharacterized protein YpmS